MAGLDKIIDQITSEAKKEAEGIIAEANEKAKEILAEAQSESAKVTAGIQKKSASDVENYKKRVQSSNDLYRRTETLKSKQAVIAKVIDDAYDKVCNMDKQSYFDMLEKMIGKFALAQEGEICFSQADLDAMPADFEGRIAAAAKKNGGALTLSKEGKNIDKGFVLVYGGIEENCTISALFDARREEMQDTVNALLYGKEA